MSLPLNYTIYVGILGSGDWLSRNPALCGELFRYDLWQVELLGVLSCIYVDSSVRKISTIMEIMEITYNDESEKIRGPWNENSHIHPHFTTQR